METIMATTQVTVPDRLALGRNGVIGTLDVDWSRVPQQVLDHIASVYLPQYLTDSANAGGRDEPPAERLGRVQKKLEAMYAGQVRVRGEAAAKAADPVEKEAYEMAKAALVKTAKTSAAWKSVPKALRKGDAGIVHALNAIAAEKGDPERGSIADWIAHTLELNPEIRKAAERIVREQAKTVKIAL
jgi:hypothetical protein